MKTKLSYLLTVTLLLTTIVGGGPAIGAERTTVDLHLWGNVARWQEVLDSFHAAHPDIRMELQGFGGSAFALQEALMVRLAGGVPPDLVATNFRNHRDVYDLGIL